MAGLPAGFDVTNPVCPQCGGGVWDNRTNKKSPKAPDFKCKNRESCDWAAWTTPPQGGGNRGGGGNRSASAPPRPVLTADQRKAGRAMVLADYLKLMQHVAPKMAAMAKADGMSCDMGNVQAATYSIYSTMNTKGYLPDVEAPVPAPIAAPIAPPAPPPPPNPPRRAMPQPVTSGDGFDERGRPWDDPDDTPF